MAGNITAVIVAFIGFGGVALGIYFSRKGQKRSDDSQRVAEVYKAQASLIADLRTERDDLRIEIRAANERTTHEREMHLDQVTLLTGALGELRAILAGQVADSAALVSEEDPHSPEAVQRVREFIESMKEMGG